MANMRLKCNGSTQVQIGIKKVVHAAIYDLWMIRESCYFGDRFELQNFAVLFVRGI